MSVRKTLLYSVAVVFPLLVACSDSRQPVAPADPVATPPPPPPLPAPVPPSPSPARKGVVYVAAQDLDALYGKYHGASLTSRYVLYDDSTFTLEFESGKWGPFGYNGRFTRADSRITFIWEGWSSAGPWGAEGTLTGDSLSVRYNLIMQLTDFIDGAYARVSE